MREVSDQNICTDFACPAGAVSVLAPRTAQRSDGLAGHTPVQVAGRQAESPARLRRGRRANRHAVRQPARAADQRALPVPEIIVGTEL